MKNTRLPKSLVARLVREIRAKRLTVKEVVKRHHVADGTVYRWLKAAKHPEAKAASVAPPGPPTEAVELATLVLRGADLRGWANDVIRQAVSGGYILVRKP